jgi:hypothetical protein
MADAFWMVPDWSGGDRLGDGAEPFWMIPPAMERNEKYVRRRFARKGYVSTWCGMTLPEIEDAVEMEDATWEEVADDIRSHNGLFQGIAE